ncbi:peptidoglycan recognition protein family protein [Paraburkholderia sediminicola]|uniref:peptidoglycan recognition protein family protein n=2 Tax=Paraburkholderia sediminicola TaxID=458836 RepID=UPI0038B9AB4F
MVSPYYSIEHWSTANAMPDYKNNDPVEITVNDRAATRQAIINAVRRSRTEFVERSSWAAHKAKTASMQDDWDYRGIAVHHAGRSFTCGPAALQLQDIQSMQMDPTLLQRMQGKMHADDIGYHYAIDCFGNIYEGRDIRFKGEHLFRYNTGIIGIVLLENLAEPEERKDLAGRMQSLVRLLGKNGPQIPDRQKDSLRKLVEILSNVFYILVLGGHREFQNQSAGEGRICPGNVGLEFVKTLRASLRLSSPS